VRRSISVLTVAAITAAMLATSAVPALALSPWVERVQGGPVSFSTCIWGHGTITVVDGEFACVLADW
jgi:hypothetical protein